MLSNILSYIQVFVVDAVVAAGCIWTAIWLNGRRLIALQSGALKRRPARWFMGFAIAGLLGLFSGYIYLTHFLWSIPMHNLLSLFGYLVLDAIVLTLCVSVLYATGLKISMSNVPRWLHIICSLALIAGLLGVFGAFVYWLHFL